ncbi:hypothetical protein B9Z55_011543 [Caenorhabditis nigoni]|uniref:Uncharacterized protein n=1 Tax=Caenorhabditis nigoni TaxID=1611254 RepID=A0A2G5UKH3_9PELO|nr:hypothetical protein B9Z55_011543 [Caenorhabditis nigoni]
MRRQSSSSVNDMHRGVPAIPFESYESKNSEKTFYIPNPPKKEERVCRFPIGNRTTDTRCKILDEITFFMPITYDFDDIENRTMWCVRRLREMINLFVDYIEQNFKDTIPTKGRRELPMFPDAFHKTIQDVGFVCWDVFRLDVDYVNLYTAIHRCILVFDPTCTFKYLEASEDLSRDDAFFRARQENLALRNLSEKRFDKFSNF